MRRLVSIAGLVALVLASMLLAQWPSVAALAAWIDVHETRLLLGVGAILAVGFTLFFLGIVKLLMDHGEPLSHAEVEDVERSVRLADRPVFARATRYRVFGRSAGRGGSEEFRLTDLKRAWRSGAVRRDPMWRRRALTAAGALSMFTGLCALFVVVGPPWIKVLCWGLFVFVAGRLALAWSRV